MSTGMVVRLLHLTLKRCSPALLTVAIYDFSIDAGYVSRSNVKNQEVVLRLLNTLIVFEQAKHARNAVVFHMVDYLLLGITLVGLCNFAHRKRSCAS